MMMMTMQMKKKKMVVSFLLDLGSYNGEEIWVGIFDFSKWSIVEKDEDDVDLSDLVIRVLDDTSVWPERESFDDRGLREVNGDSDSCGDNSGFYQFQWWGIKTLIPIRFGGGGTISGGVSCSGTGYGGGGCRGSFR
ncbi:hypothetical protein Tco_1182736 [Tanacetum coccineum]